MKKSEYRAICTERSRGFTRKGFAPRMFMPEVSGAKLARKAREGKL
jgi:hypothetical protein